MCDDVTLVVSELVANAARHAGTEIRLTLIRGPSGLRVEIADGSTRALRPRAASLLAQSGRGLDLVAAIASRNGVEQLPDGKIVWAVLDFAR